MRAKAQTPVLKLVGALEGKGSILFPQFSESWNLTARKNEPKKSVDQVLHLHPQPRRGLGCKVTSPLPAHLCPSGRHLGILMRRRCYLGVSSIWRQVEAMVDSTSAINLGNRLPRSDYSSATCRVISLLGLNFLTCEMGITTSEGC